MEFVENLFHHQQNNIEELDLFARETSDAMTNLFKTFEEIGSQNTDYSEPKDIVQENNVLESVDNSELLVDLDEFNSILNDCDGNFASIEDIKTVLGTDATRSLLNIGYYFSDANELLRENFVEDKNVVPIPTLIDYNQNVNDLGNNTVESIVAQTNPDSVRGRANKNLWSESVSYCKEEDMELINEFKQETPVINTCCDTFSILSKCSIKLETDNTNNEHMTPEIAPLFNDSVNVQYLTGESTNLPGFSTDFYLKLEKNDISNEHLNAEARRQLKDQRTHSEIHSSVDNFFKGCFDVMSIGSTDEDDISLSNLKLHKDDPNNVKNKDLVSIIISSNKGDKQITNTENKFRYNDPIQFIEKLDSDNCSGYNSSDFEFITESDAELEGIVKYSQKKKPETKPKNKIDSEEVAFMNKDTNISLNQYVCSYVDKGVAGSSNALSTSKLQFRPIPDYKITLEHDDFEITRLTKKSPINNLEFRTSDPKITSKHDINVAGPSKVTATNNLKSKTPDPKITYEYDAMNIAKYNLKIKTSPDLKITAEHSNIAGPSKVIPTNNLKFKPILETNNSKKFGRPRLPVIDFNYRNKHRIPDGEDYLNLFRGYHIPALPLSDTIFLENKSIQRTYMHVEYDGLGFDLRKKNRNYNCDEENKDEANECAKRIMSTYTANNKRRKRF